MRSRRSRLPRVHTMTPDETYTPTPADRAPYPRLARHVATGLGAGLLAFGLWGLIEPHVRLTRISGATMDPFPAFSHLHFAYTAVSITLYALIGAITGILLGAALGGLHALVSRAVHRKSLTPVASESGLIRFWRRPPAPAFAAYLGPIYFTLASWLILSFAAFYFLNRLVPGSFRSPRSIRMSAMGFGGAMVAALILLLILILLHRAGESRPALRATWRRIGFALAVLLVIAALTTGTLFLFHDAGAGGTARAHTAGPHVILVSIDALRADHLSAYGYPRPTTPVIDGLARQGVLFERAFTQAPSSTPAHASMLTGYFPTHHGAVTNGDVLVNEVVTVAERFREAGYRTGGFLTNPWLSRQFGFSQGFDVYIESGIMQQANQVYPALFAGNLFATQAWGKVRNDDLSFLRALRWIQGNADQPFFLFLHLLDPHGPYDPPETLLREFLPANATPLEAVIAAYDGDIRAADEKVGRLLAFLDRLGIRGETIICITADHGETMEEHEPHYGHGTLYDTNLHVPLVVAGRVPEGRRVREPVASIDIVPTLLSLAGQTRSLAAEPVQGIDLSATLDASAAVPDTALHAIRPIFSQRARAYAVRVGDWKLLWEPGGVPILYDIARDPGETRDVAPENPPIVATLWETLSAWVDRENATARTPESRVEELDAATRERLKALGYLR